MLVLRRPALAAAVLAAALVGLAVLPGVASANIVVNGGFETGDLTGWTINPSPSGGFPWAVQPTGGGGPGVANSGNFYVSTGCIGGGCLDPGSGAWLSQGLPATPGQNYDLTFAYDPSVGGPTELQVTWDGNLVFDQLDNNITDPGYAVETVLALPATATSTTLTFLGRQDFGVDALDDASVDPSGTVTGTPEPSSLVLFTSVLPCLAGMGALRLRTARARGEMPG